jgi:hypothetical protein
MSYEIPHHYEPQIEQIAQEQHISHAEALDRILRAGIERFQPIPATAKSPPQRSYASFFGAVKNGYGSPEAVDRAIEEMRNEW